nr:MAG TPA: Peptidase [Bacteriophage sp.]
MANYKTSWVRRLIDGAWKKTFAFAHAKTVYTDYAKKKTLADKLSEIDTEIGNKANKTEIPTELPANGGNSATVNGHTVKSDVPENAVFTDTKIQKRISDNSYGEVAGGKNFYNCGNEVGGINSDGGENTETNRVRSKGYIKVNSSTTYTASVKNKNIYLGIYLYDKEKKIISVFSWQKGDYTFKTTDITEYVRVTYRTDDDISVSDILEYQIEEGTTATSYEPYFESNKMLAEENAQQSAEMMDIKMLGWSVPRECPIQNEVSGNQFMQKVGRVEASTLDWWYQSQYARFNTSIVTDMAHPSGTRTDNNLYLSGYSTISDGSDIANVPNKSIYSTENSEICIHDSTYTDASAFKSAMQGKYLYYELANPVAMSIDGNEIDRRHSTNLTNQQNNGYLQKNLVDYKSLFADLTDNAEGTTHTYSDGILKISRTANIYSGVYIYSGQITPLQGKDLIVSFDAKASVTTMNLRVYISEGGVPVTTENLTTKYKRYCLDVKAGSTENNLVIYGNNVAGDVWIKNFMITEKYVTDATYVDPVKSNMELDICKADKSETTVNIFKPTSQTATQKGITCTNNGDGTYTISGTSTAQVTFQLAVNVKAPTSCILTGCKGGSPTTYMFGVYDGTNYFEVYDVDNAKEIEAKTYKYAYIVVRSGVTLPDNVIISPMITTNLSATYSDFVPYTGDTGSLNGDVAEKAPKKNPVFTESVTVGSRLSSSNFGQNSFTNGDTSQATGNNSFASGDHPVSDGANSQSLGCYAVAKANQCAIGHFNSSSSDDSSNYGTTGTAFYIGNGTMYTRSNAFRVSYDGTPYSKAGLNTTGADYAEFFEWEDGNENNEDRRGYFVTLDGKYIRIANEGDWILGIVSGFPAIIGNGDEEWKGRYVFDDFGCPVIEEFEYEEEVPEVITNSEGEEEVITKRVKKTGTKWKEVPEYDPERPYVQRSERQEWSAVGMLGVLSVRDDGTCKVNGFCKLTDGGIATDSETGYRVVKRVTDNIVEVIFK